MSVGTSKAFRSGTGIAIIVNKNVCLEQGIEAGHTVEYSMRKMEIEKKGPTRGLNMKKKAEEKPEEPVDPEPSEAIVGVVE